MIKNEYVPAHILRLYTWELLRQNLGWSPIPYGSGSLIPVIPSEDEPKIAESGRPYIIYGWTENLSGGLVEHRRGVFSMRIIAKTSDEVTKIINTIALAFQEGDISASSINWYSTNFTADLEGIRFTSTDITYIESAGPPDAENSPQEGIISVAYRYITSQKVKTYQSNGQWA